MRTGLIAQKVGMSSLYTERGKRCSITILQVKDCQVVAKKVKDKDGYNALVIGTKNLKSNRISKVVKGFFSKSLIPPKSILKEFRVSDNSMLDIGTYLDVNHFVTGQFLDVTGFTIGKGFAGVMKRHNFRGLEASHGVSISHRSHGSTGGRQDPGKVFKNKKMAGQMGNARVTIQNLRVLNIDKKENLIMILGCIPGAKNSYVYVKDAIKK